MKIFLSLLLTTVLTFAYNANSKLYKGDLDANSAYKMIQKEANILFIDVRTKREYSANHAKGSLLIPVFFEKNGKRVFNEEFVKQIKKAVKDKLDKKIVLICRSGSRSRYASNLLAKEGFSSVYNVLSGMDARGGWRESNLP